MKQLKKSAPAFQVTVGPFAGRRYEHGVSYDDKEIPKGDAGKFETIPVVAPRKSANKKEEQSDK